MNKKKTLVVTLLASFAFAFNSTLAQTYCNPGSRDCITNSNYITNVNINSGGINNNSSNTSCNGGYNFYSSTNTNLAVGGTYSQIYTVYTTGFNYLSAWIDYNQDGIFSNSELITPANYTTPNTFAPPAQTANSGNFIVPCSAMLGKTRLRVAIDNGSVFDACTSSSGYGEVEDYYVTLVAPSTTLTWVGGSGTGATRTNWAVAANWSPAIIPTSCYNIIIPNTIFQPIVGATTSASCANIRINPTASLTIQSNSAITNVNLSLYGNIINDGTINFTGSQTRTNNFLQLFSSNGTISGNGSYLTLPMYFNNQSNYIMNNDVQLTTLYIDNVGFLSLNNINFSILKGITQNGEWKLNNATVSYSAPTAPYFTASKLNTGTSNFYYNATASNQLVTEAIYYNLKLNNNITFNVRVGTGGNITCQDFTIVQGTAVTIGYVYLYYPITINGNMTINSGCVLDANDHASGTVALTTDNSITLFGNWTNHGSFINGNGNNAGAISNPRTVILSGGNPQLIGGTNPTSFYNIILNKSAGVTTLAADSTIVSNQISLNNNILDLNTKLLKLTCAGIALSTSAITKSGGYVLSEDINVNARIKWNIGNILGTYIFPFGYGGTYIPFTFQLTGGDAGYVSVATYHTPANNFPYPPSVTHIYDTTSTMSNNADYTIDRFWQINKFGTTGTANITFSYTASEAATMTQKGGLPTPSENQLRAQRWANSGGWQTWRQNASQTVNTISHNVSVSGVTQFSPWALACTVMPLPVELVHFNVQPRGRSVQLNWKTSSEKNNAMFIVERSSDGISFEPIANIKGHGNSNIAKFYSTTDNAPYKGLSYYRLKQIDFNGKFKHSEIKHITLIEKSTLLITPNPVNINIINLTFSIQKNDDAVINVFDEFGRSIYKSENFLVFNGENKLNLDVSNFKPGLYMLKIIMNSSEHNARFIKE